MPIENNPIHSSSSSSSVQNSNRLENHTSSHLIQTTLTTRANSPLDGKNLFAFGDCDGSWINLLKQLHARGVVQYTASDNESFDTRICDMEANEVSVRESFHSHDIKSNTDTLTLDANRLNLAETFGYINDLESFFNKLSSPTIDGKSMQVVLIGDLLNDRLTNNYPFILLLACLNQILNLNIIHSNHDFMAVTLFTKLEALVLDYQSQPDFNDTAIGLIQEQVFKPLLVELNTAINCIKTRDGTLTGVHFGFSSVSWFYTLQYLVEQKKSLSPITNFLDLLNNHYYPNIELVLSRKFGQADAENLGVFTHAPLRLYSPNFQGLGLESLKSMYHGFKHEDQVLRGGKYTPDPLTDFGIEAMQFKINQMVRFSVGNMFGDLIHFIENKYNTMQNDDKDALISVVNHLKHKLRTGLQNVANFVYGNASGKQVIAEVDEVIKTVQETTNICKQRDWFKEVLSSNVFLKYTENRTLFRAPYSKHVLSIHGHIGCHSDTLYNPLNAQALNLDSNGNRPEAPSRPGQFRVFESKIVSNQTAPQSPKPNGVALKPTPNVNKIQRQVMNDLQKRKRVGLASSNNKKVCLMGSQDHQRSGSDVSNQHGGMRRVSTSRNLSSVQNINGIFDNNNGSSNQASGHKPSSR